MIPTWFLSFWICNCSSTTLMLPITYALLLQLKDSKEDINERTSKYWKFENFREGFISRNFAYAKFRENYTLAKCRNHFVVYLCTSIMALSRIFSVTHMSFNAIRENKILVKTSGFTVLFKKSNWVLMSRGGIRMHLNISARVLRRTPSSKTEWPDQSRGLSKNKMAEDCLHVLKYFFCP